MARPKRQIPFASGGWLRKEISDDQWSLLEKVIRRPIDKGLRASIQKATDDYLADAPFEDRAPVDSTNDRIIEIKKSAAAFCNAIFKQGDSVLLAKALIKKNLKGQLAHAHEADPLRSAGMAARSIVRACNDALKVLVLQAQDPSWKDGDAWNAWVRKLTKILEKSDVPVAASKGSSDISKPSLFVEFVSKIQECVPEGFRRSTHSHDALAQAITRARSNAPAGQISSGFSITDIVTEAVASVERDIFDSALRPDDNEGAGRRGRRTRRKPRQ